ncbi:ABC transporter permease [Terrimonas sp.]|uniref:ABC transporter permease n=1 Tax=Terrimonas sp. TaxID=1914338 RepID=UPI000D50EDF8|nr:ABC transporter permease [Terrimonas sp.]PVD50438.1 ABC transporter permease [Terrimonas sp.]
MFRNYLKIACRNLWKNKVFSSINIIGLAIGMAACLVILVFVLYEKNFDGFHTKNIYRLNEVQKFEGMVEPQNVALSMFPMGPTLKSEFPEVENFARVRQQEKYDLNYGDKKIYLEKAFFVDSTFLRMFDFSVSNGNRNVVLQTPNSVVLTRETAHKIFGSENPIGKTIVHYIGDTINFKVTGIMDDVPENSHLQFDALFSFSTIVRPQHMENWGGNWLVTYLQLAPGTNTEAMEAKFPAYLKRHMSANDNWKFYELFLQPLKDVHAASANITHDYVNYQKFNKTYTYLFSVIGIIILLIAAINFMNLSTAKSAERAKEVGIRKSVGAKRSQLSLQFIGESILLTLMAFVLAILLAVLFLPYMSQLSGRELRLPLFSNAQWLISLFGAALLLGFISGIYPALFLSSFNTIKVLKGGAQSGKSVPMLRNILVVTQFSSAIFLIIATVFAVRQLRYMEKKDTGFDKEQVMIIPLDRATSPKFNALKTELKGNPLVVATTGSRQTLGNNLHQSGFTFHSGKGPARSMASSQVVVDPDYLTLYNIKLVAGRNFNNGNAADNGRTYIVNETMAKELLKDDPGQPFESLLGKKFGFSFDGLDTAGTIIGVAKDFNFNSLHHKIETLSIFNKADVGFSEMSVKINGSKAKEAISYVESVWNKLMPGSPFEYSFLDEHFAELYKADSQVSKVVGILAVLAVVISCLGLFGLSSYAAEKRVKEIGIRKVLGASVGNITATLSKDFIKLVLIANVIAWPVAWYIISNWLNDFAYRIPVSWMVFIAAGGVALAIAVITISFQAIKAAMANPVKSLRTE